MLSFIIIIIKQMNLIFFLCLESCISKLYFNIIYFKIKDHRLSTNFKKIQKIWIFFLNFEFKKFKQCIMKYNFEKKNLNL